jgi:hypothetical protein
MANEKLAGVRNLISSVANSIQTALWVTFFDERLKSVGEAVTSGDPAGQEQRLRVLLSEIDQRRASVANQQDYTWRRGAILTLLGRTLEAAGDDEGATASFREAVSALGETGLKDLPANILVHYAKALLRNGDVDRATAAMRAALHRGMGKRVIPFAVEFLDALARTGNRTNLLKALAADLAEVGEAGSQQGRVVAATLERHGFTTLAGQRRLVEGAAREARGETEESLEDYGHAVRL